MSAARGHGGQKFFARGRKVFRAALTGACFALVPFAAAAETVQIVCANHAAFAEKLAEQYGESVRASALSARGHVLELWASAESWTLLLVVPSGEACAIDQGLRAVIIAPPVPGDPA